MQWQQLLRSKASSWCRGDMSVRVKTLACAPTPVSPKILPVKMLDVVVGQRAAAPQLLATEEEALLGRGDALLVLDLLRTMTALTSSQLRPLSHRASG